MQYNNKSESGFTLIELSIVLVIIGLIVGGVLVGQDLIRAAEIRATVSQIEKYNTAVNTFRSKYNGIPGDLASAANYGMTAATQGTGVQEGDGLLESSDGSVEASATIAGMETSLFWKHLSFANLIEYSFTLAGAGNVGTLASTAIPNYFPAAKIGRGNYLAVYSALGINYYQISGITATTTGAYTLGYAMTPREAFNIDTKLDDGLPTTGITRGMRSTSTLGTTCDPTASSGAGDACCGDNGSGNANIYKMSTSALANAQSCQLRLRFN